MTPTQQYYAGTLDYEKLTEDEQNGVVAEMEGWEFHRGTGYVSWSRFDGNARISHDDRPPGYLYSWDLLGPLLAKHCIGVSVYANTDPKIYYAKVLDGGRGYGEGSTPEAAIVHALCEIAREQQKEAPA